MSTLSHHDARRVYDRIGSFQDSQAFYEDRTTGELVEHGAFDTASRVFEFGCGTGRFAALLFASRLPATATYRGIDLSPTMVRLARERLAALGERAEVALSEGGPPTAEPTAAFDRWVSTFVLDLLSEDDIDAVLAEAHRMLTPNGLLCLAGLSIGHVWYASAVATLWSALHRLAPELVGGCRPLDLRRHLGPQKWQVVHYKAVAAYGIPSEAIIAQRL